MQSSPAAHPAARRQRTAMLPFGRPSNSSRMEIAARLSQPNSSRGRGGAHSSRERQPGSPVSAVENTIDLTGQSDEDEVQLTGGVIPRGQFSSAADFHRYHNAVNCAWERVQPLYPQRPAVVSKAVESPPRPPVVEKPCAVCLEELSEPACGPCGWAIFFPFAE